MNSEYYPNKDTSVRSECDRTINGIMFSRSIVHKGRIAPKGFVFFIIKMKAKGKILGMHQLIAAGLTDEQELSVQNRLLADFKKHFKI